METHGKGMETWSALIDYSFLTEERKKNFKELINHKADALAIKKLTHGNPTMKEKFDRPTN